MTFFSKQSELNSPTICGTRVTLVVQEAGFTVVFFNQKLVKSLSKEILCEAV